MVLRMEPNTSYVRQILYHLVTPLAPKPIFRVVSILRTQDLWDPALMPCPKHTAPPVGTQNGQEGWPAMAAGPMSL